MPVRAVDILKQLIMTPDPEAQAQIIKDAWNSDQEDFFIGIDLASNPAYNFGLEKVPEIDEDDDGSGDFSFEDFYNLAMLLANGKIAGPDAKHAVTQAALAANVSEWNLWYRRILLKTLPKYLPVAVIRKTLLELTSG